METKPFGPVHEYVTPPVGEFPCKMTDKIVQVITPPVALAPGTPLPCTTVAEAEAVHPLLRLVTKIW